MKTIKQPKSLRTHLLFMMLLCWVLPILSVSLLAGILLSRSYEQSARQELDSRAQNAMEQLEIRMNTVFRSSSGHALLPVSSALILPFHPLKFNANPLSVTIDKKRVISYNR